MKKRLFMIATCLLMSGLALANPTLNPGTVVPSGSTESQVTPAPPPVSINLSVVFIPNFVRCIQALKIEVSGWNYSVRVRKAYPITNVSFVSFTYAVPPNSQPYAGPHYNTTQTFYLEANPPGPTLYKVELWEATNPNSPIVKYITVHQGCFYRGFEVLPAFGGGKIAAPEDPEEALLTDLEIKWRLEEIDPNTGEPVFTIEDPLNWMSCKEPGASNAFNGFNGYDGASIAALQAGSTSTNPGVFNPDRTYKLTRSTKLPEEDLWVDCVVYLGPGMDEVVEEPWDEAWEERSATAELIGVPDLFTLGQDRDAKTVIFNTTTDSGTLEIYDVAGNKVKVIALQKESFTYEVNAALLGKGLYIAQMQSGVQATVKKFTIE